MKETFQVYIIHQTIANDDPRLHPDAVVVGDYWHFTIRYIPPEKDIYIDWLNYLELPEGAAKSSVLTNNYKGVVSLVKPVDKVDDIVTASGDVEWEKHVYRLTEEDKQNVTMLIKTAMRLYATENLTDNKKLKKLLQKVNACTNQEECENILHHYYKVSTSPITHNTPREPEFNIKWPGNEK